MPSELLLAEERGSGDAVNVDLGWTSRLVVKSTVLWRRSLISCSGLEGTSDTENYLNSL